MTPETARTLAQAIKLRDEAGAGLTSLLRRQDIRPVSPVQQAWRTLGETYAHEQRIINRIIEEERDE